MSAAVQPVPRPVLLPLVLQRRVWFPNDGVFGAYHDGCNQLLQRCAPRLRSLQLLGVHAWDADTLMRLQQCTALTGLQLEARWMAEHHVPNTHAAELHIGEQCNTWSAYC